MGKSSKNFVTLFFVTLFFVVKVAGLHALSHHDDDSNIQHCEVCEISTAVNFTPLLEAEPTVLQNSAFLFVKQQLNDKALAAIYNNKYLSGYLFTRPPPQSL